MNDWAKQAREYVNSKWIYINSKLSIVSGKDLLRATNKWLKDCYNTSCSMNRIFSVMVPEDVDDEIVELLNKLVGWRKRVNMENRIPASNNTDMFPLTAIFQKLAKNPLTCSHVQMLIHGKSFGTLPAQLSSGWSKSGWKCQWTVDPGDHWGTLNLSWKNRRGLWAFEKIQLSWHSDRLQEAEECLVKAYELAEKFDASPD